MWVLLSTGVFLLFPNGFLLCDQGLDFEIMLMRELNQSNENISWVRVSRLVCWLNDAMVFYIAASMSRLLQMGKWIKNGGGLLEKTNRAHWGAVFGHVTRSSLPCETTKTSNESIAKIMENVLGWGKYTGKWMIDWLIDWIKLLLKSDFLNGMIALRAYGDRDISLGTSRKTKGNVIQGENWIHPMEDQCQRSSAGVYSPSIFNY